VNPDHLHRLVKLLADSGESATLDEAHATFANYGLVVDVGPTGLLSETAQIQALTLLNCAARSFLDHVAIRGRADIALTVRGFVGTTLAQFLDCLAPDRPQPLTHWPVVALAGSEDPSAIRPWASGAAFGLGAAPDAHIPTAAASVAAGGLAISEVFSLMRGDNPYAGRRSIHLDLDQVTCAPHHEPTSADATAPPLWLVGLGHLGQAYAWTLGFMVPSSEPIVLQDTDQTTISTLSTSLLSFREDVGHAKTEVVARWLRSRGWDVRIVDRDFDANQRWQPGEPRVALFGVDNAAARRALEAAGFEHVVDAGLGAGFQDFRAIRVRTFPGASSASEIWASEPVHAVPQTPAYQDLLQHGGDACGVTTLATRAVGAPFVGAVAAGLAVTAALAISTESSVASVVDVNLRDPQRVFKA
jgi:ThiF family